ncbi:Efg1 protein [Candida orthopsilosis Co 90-125]|uniref:rRNA-processing protein EFG1 n=1 Tax=Candida orthopsilosis (strain 90-125) TaxID=1136231 RepID=H8X982_CANO9|nr:Efg1 protein [Candida orthopsilosis Co 90-125]CCG24381.1 Efg1 protein [Candida orthopsilosis Co 90-125]
MPKTKKSHRANRNSHIEVSKAIDTGSSAKLKKKIRDIERLLSKNDKLPADKKIEYERALKGLKVELQNSQNVLKAKNNATKYHMVRFFEKKKAIRKLKQLRKAYEDVQKTEVRKDIKKARKQLKHGEIDLVYVMLFPKSEKYISLYPSANDEDLSDPNVKIGLRKTEARRLEFRKEVEKMMEEGKVPFTVDDIMSGKKVKTDVGAVRVAPTAEIDAPEQKDSEPQEDDFFE